MRWPISVAGASSVLAIARYPASVMTRITHWLAVLEANEVIAGGGTRHAAIEARKTARKALEKLNLRVRFCECAAVRTVTTRSRIHARP